MIINAQWSEFFKDNGTILNRLPEFYIFGFIYDRFVSEIDYECSFEYFKMIYVKNYENLWEPPDSKKIVLTKINQTNTCSDIILNMKSEYDYMSHFCFLVLHRNIKIGTFILSKLKEISIKLPES